VLIQALGEELHHQLRSAFDKPSLEYPEFPTRRVRIRELRPDSGTKNSESEGDKALKTLLLGLMMVGFLPSVSGATGVQISSPADQAVVSSPVQLVASSQGRTTVSSISVYANGVLVAQERGTSSIDTAIDLSPGSYAIEVLTQYRNHTSASATSNITVSGSGSGGTSTNSSVASQIAGDMTGGNEGSPHGVPSSYDFYYGPWVGEGNNIAPNTAIEWWGGLYVGPNGNPATNTLVNIRACALYWLSASTGKWTAVNFTPQQIDSDFYSEDWTVDYGTSVPMRIESDGSFSISTVAGKVAHFYAPYPRIPVNNSDLGGVVAILEARLILNNANGTDDRSIASFLLDTGADPYPSTTGPGIENNPNIGLGKFKYVTTNWRSFAMTTMTQSQLQNNPPPVNLNGVLP
jgi:Bacterial Ig domain